MPKFKTSERSDDRQTGRRIFIVGAVIACSFGILLCRAIYFRLKDNDQLEGVALRQYRTAVTQSTKRGRILDAKGRDLAIDVTVDSVFANPRKISEPVKASNDLASALNIDRRKLLDRLSSNRKFMWIKRKISEDESKKVEALGMDGIYMMRENNRFYPGKALASTILGAVGFDSEPLGGIELYYSDSLSSQSKPGKFRRDARGHLYLSPSDDAAYPIANVELTIDRTIQFLAEKELEAGVRRANAKGGSAVVVDVNSGAMLAMANYPSFDPNEYASYPLSNWRNRAMVDPYEPGSTFKVIVISAALDRGVVNSEDIFDCENGKVQVADHIIGDAHPHGKLSVADIVKVSSNIGAYKVSKRLSRQELYDGIRAFGFGSKSSIDLPGESVGIVSAPGSWSELQQATIAFGQGIAATPLQMAMAMASIANGGSLLKPYVVKRIVDENGMELSAGRTEVAGYPIKPATAALMRRLLKSVVERGGTGTLAASLEYQMAGKTGTAQKADPVTGGYAKGKYYASFVGFAPFEKPRVAVFVGIDEPRGGMYYGGQVAAPVFKNIAEGALEYMMVPGDIVVASSDTKVHLPPVGVEGDLAVVTSLGGNHAAYGTFERQIVQDGDSSWRVPDLTGMTMREVLEAARDSEIEWRFEGSGVAINQSVAPGDAVSAGEVCKVEFRPLM